jgi:hypothetical protein
MTIFTVGDNYIPIAPFIQLRTLYGIGTLVDGRSQPHSRSAPQFNLQAVHTPLEQGGIARRYR